MNALRTPQYTSAIATREFVGIGDAEYFQYWYDSRPAEWYSGILAEVVRNGRPGSLLDLGCGTGLLTELASRWGVDVLGIDGSPAAIESALRRCPRLPVRQAFLSEALSIASDSFDNAILNQVIEHLSPATMETVMAECRRVLKPGGVLFVFSPSRANRTEVEKDPTHCNPLLPSELNKLLRAAGFEVFHQPNTPRFFADNRAISWLSRRLLNGPFDDWLSGTANAYARKR